MTRLRVLFAYLHDEQSPGPRYRVLQFLPALTSSGFDCTTISMQSPASTDRTVSGVLRPRVLRAWHHIVVWLQTLPFQWRIVRMAKRFDRIVLYRVPVSRWARWLLRHRRADVIVDFDDALDAVPAEDHALLGGLKAGILRRGLENAILASTTAITSNANNRKIVERLGRRAVVIPTCIDLSRVPFRDRAATLESKFVIGWIGTPSTALYLAAIEDALRDVTAAHGAVVRLVGAGRSPFRRLPVELVNWSVDREVDDVNGFDAGLMPMPDTPWTRGKAALKALQYGASGAPTVASFTPTNVELLGEHDGVLFARTPEDWIRHLSRLIEDAALRADLGRRGRARVAERYSVEINAPLLAGVIRYPSGAQM